MTASVPSIAPTELTAGDSATWTFYHTDYPSTSFDLSYAWVGVDKLKWISSFVTKNADGSFTVLVPMSATAPLKAGSYNVTRTVTDGTTGKSWQLDPLNISANPTNQIAGSTRTAKLEADLAAAERIHSARISGDQPEKYMIGGMSVEKMTDDYLVKLISRLQAALWRARNPGMIRQRVVRFTVPSA